MKNLTKLFLVAPFLFPVVNANEVFIDARLKKDAPKCDINSVKFEKSENTYTFMDDFNTGSIKDRNILSFNNKNIENWYIRHGKLYEISNLAKAAVVYNMCEHKDSKNYNINADIITNQGNTYNEGVGIVFALKDSFNYYRVTWDSYSMNYSKNGDRPKKNHKNFKLTRVVEGLELTLDSIEPKELNEKFNLDINVDSNGILVKVDGKEQLKSSKTPSLNSAGLWTYDNDGGIYYDNFKVVINKNTSLKVNDLKTNTLETNNKKTLISPAVKEETIDYSNWFVGAGIGLSIIDATKKDITNVVNETREPSEYAPNINLELGYRFNKDWFAMYELQIDKFSDIEIYNNLLSINRRIMDNNFNPYIGLAAGLSYIKIDKEHISKDIIDDYGKDTVYGLQLGLEKKYDKKIDFYVQYQYLKMDHKTNLLSNQSKSIHERTDHQNLNFGIRYNFR